MTELQKLKADLATAKEELSNCGRSKPQFLIDDDDEYQDQLELGWAKEEIRDRIASLEKQISEHVNTKAIFQLNGDAGEQFNEMQEENFWEE